MIAPMNLAMKPATGPAAPEPDSMSEPLRIAGPAIGSSSTATNGAITSFRMSEMKNVEPSSSCSSAVSVCSATSSPNARSIASAWTWSES